MVNFILRRIAYGFLVLVGVVTVIFLLFNVLPGDPARMMVGQRADQAALDAINRDLGLDKPMRIQFFMYVNDLSILSVHNDVDESHYLFLDDKKYISYVRLFSIGDQVMILKFPYLRRSYQTKRQVTELILDALPETAVLGLTAMFFATLLGIIMGIFSAINKGGWLDNYLLIGSVMGVSLPSFFAALIIAWIFGYLLSEYTGLNMYGSLWTIDDYGDGEYLSLQNLILPAFTLGIRPLAVIVQLTRSSMLDVLSHDYIRTAKAKGLSGYTIIVKHALKNAMNPVITAVSGWLAGLMAGSVFIEKVFDWKGLGYILVKALEKYDFPVVMGCVLLIAVVFVVVNIIVDITYGFLDPRVRVS